MSVLDPTGCWWGSYNCGTLCSEVLQHCSKGTAWTECFYNNCCIM